MAKSKSRRAPEPAVIPRRRKPARLSPAGQWIGWGAWGAFVLVGFCFGVWAGTPKSGAKAPVEVAAVTPATEPTKPEPAKVEPPKVEPPKTVAKVEPPKPPEPKKVEPEPKKPEPMAVEPPPKPPEPKKVVPEPKKPEPVADVSFAKHLKPIFIAKCVVCHEGPRAKAGIDVTTVAAIMKGGKKGAILTVGDLAGSSLWTSVDGNEMPPDDSGKPPLTADEKKLLKDWVLGGAKP